MVIEDAPVCRRTMRFNAEELRLADNTAGAQLPAASVRRCTLNRNFYGIFSVGGAVQVDTGILPAVTTVVAYRGNVFQTNRVHVATAGSRLNLGQNGCDLALCP